MKTPVVVNLTLVASVALVACNSHKAATSSASRSKPAPAAAPAGTTAAAAPAKPAPVEMASYDLSAAGKKWKGWTAQGVKGAKVMVDGISAARIAANGPSILDQKPGGDNGFDITFEQTKESLKKLKHTLQKGAKNGRTLDFTQSEPDLLEWTEHVGKETAYNFVEHMKVDRKNITCKSNIMVGAGNQAELKREMDACKTLAYKK